MCAEPLTRPRRLLLLGGGLAGMLGLVALSDWRSDHLLLVNATTSLPSWAFLVDRTRQPHRGDVVLFMPPESPLVRAHFGAQPKPFGKVVYGVAGDTVSHYGRTVLVNGKPVGVAKTVSKRGEALALGPTGIIPRGCFHVGTPHPDSFDSRYAAIGWICRDRILGVGTPVL